MSTPTERRLRFDGVINTGHILTAATMLIGGFMAFSSVKSAVASMDLRVTAAEHQIATISDQVTTLAPAVAVSQNRIGNLETTAGQINATLLRLDGRLNTIQIDLSAMRGQLLGGPATNVGDE